MRRAMRLAGYGVLALALAVAALLFLHYVPFAAASFAVCLLKYVHILAGSADSQLRRRKYLMPYPHLRGPRRL
ncbi:MAG: hypothetical protein AB1714_17390 [Acidobacteriota bacterium]